jgi:hypothetical protein
MEPNIVHAWCIHASQEYEKIENYMSDMLGQHKHYNWLSAFIEYDIHTKFLSIISSAPDVNIIPIFELTQVYTQLLENPEHDKQLAANIWGRNYEDDPEGTESCIAYCGGWTSTKQAICVHIVKDYRRILNQLCKELTELSWKILKSE